MLSWCVLKTERLRRRRRRQYIVIHARVERASNLSVSLVSFFISSKLVCRIYWRFSRLCVVFFVPWFVRSPFNPFGLREWHPRTIFRSRTSRSIKYRLGRCRRRRRVYKNGKGKKERKKERDITSSIYKSTRRECVCVCVCEHSRDMLGGHSLWVSLPTATRRWEASSFTTDR